MGRLFFKIFLSFWVITAIIYLLTVLTIERPRRTEAHAVWHSMVGGALAVNAEAIAHTYEQHGCEGVGAYFQDMQRTSRLHGFLFDEQGRLLCATTAPPAAAQALARLPQANRVHFNFSRDERFASLRQQAPSGNTYVLVTELPAIMPFAAWRGLQHIAIAIAISGLFCFLLATYLARPIAKLRTAAQQIAAGNLQARAGPPATRRGDEVGELARDFDHMAAQLASLFHAQGRLITDISHELRSPLARLSVALGLARQQAAQAATPALDRMEREAERLNEMVERLLTLSRLEAAAEPPQTAIIALAELLREVAADADFEARSRNCRVEVLAAAECDIRGNAELVRSALENILRNAVHYTAENTAVEVSLERRTEAGGELGVIQVRDHGPGVPEAELPNLFRPFYRADNSRERQTGGAGLGLAIAERAITLHGGGIRVANASSGGLQFTIRLPLVAAGA